MYRHFSPRPKATFTSFPGYQQEDIDSQDPCFFLCVLGHIVLNQDRLSVDDHHYVFSPEVVQKKIIFYV